MGQLRQVLNTIQAQMTRLTASQKLLMASLAVVMLMTLFLVSQYAGGAQMVELLPGATPEQEQQAIELLQVNNIKHTTRDGRLYVPVTSKHFALAQLSQGNALPADSSLLFSNLVEKQSWAMSAQQRRQLGRLALQNELALTISQFEGIRSAKVLIDVPEPIGLGATARRPTASATVFTADGRPLTQRTVDSVAALVSGARSGLSMSDVRVIDGSNNTQRRPTSDDDAFASTNFEHTRKVEKVLRAKLLDMLVYIDGVIVAVNAQVDTRRISTESRKILPNGAGSQTFTTSESSSEDTQTASSRAGEPGVRSNTGLDINRSRGGGTTSKRTQDESTLRPEIGYENQRIVDSRGITTKLNATINIPHSYFVARYQGLNGADTQPSEEDLKPIIDLEIERIRTDIEPQVDTSDLDGGAPGTVIVSMIPDWSPMGGVSQAAGIGGMAMPGGSLTIPSIVRTVGMGGLALLSLGLMARSLKKVNKSIDLPSPQELTGAPAPIINLNPEPDMVGEAGEAHAALAGLELSDEDIDKRQMLEQVTHLIEAKPDEAVSLLNKWIEAGD